MVVCKKGKEGYCEKKHFVSELLFEAENDPHLVPLTALALYPLHKNITRLREEERKREYVRARRSERV